MVVTMTATTLTVPTTIRANDDGTDIELHPVDDIQPVPLSLLSPNQEHLESTVGHRQQRDSTLAAISQTDPSSDAIPPASPMPMPILRASIIILTLSSISFIQSLLNGILTVCLPRIASDLALPPGLLLWPASMSNLVSGCTLLLAGSLTDVFGPRTVSLIGSFLLAFFVLGSGLARTAAQLIVFRALSGLATSLSLPAAVAIATAAFERGGRRRTVAFMCLGGAQPLGFSLGLVGGGAVADGIGWRYAFLVAPVVPVAAFVLGWWSIPPSVAATASDDGANKIFYRLASTIDWSGALLASTALALLSYVLAAVTSNTSSVKEPTNIALLSSAFALLVAFVAWQSLQETKGRPALIPNSLWRNREFSTICAAVFLSWACFNANQYFMTLYMQNLQKLSGIQTSLRFQPVVFSSVAVNIVTALLVSKVRAGYLVTTSAVVTISSPLIMALAHRQAPYWAFLFPALVIEPIGADTLFTISNLVLTEAFPVQTQGLAGGVFNTLAQIGMSVGLAVAALVDASASQKWGNKITALEEGYKAVFWLCTAAQALTALVTAVGLRRGRKVGVKQD